MAPKKGTKASEAAAPAAAATSSLASSSKAPMDKVAVSKMLKYVKCWANRKDNTDASIGLDIYTTRCRVTCKTCAISSLPTLPWTSLQRPRRSRHAPSACKS